MAFPSAEEIMQLAKSNWEDFQLDTKKALIHKELGTGPMVDRKFPDRMVRNCSIGTLRIMIKAVARTYAFQQTQGTA